jgi:hypothetical protein
VAESTEDTDGASLLLLLQDITAPVIRNKRTNSFCIKYLLQPALIISYGRKAAAALL